MSEIRCPRCGEVFQIDEQGYAALLSQVRDKEFERELHQQAKALEQAAQAQQQAALAEAQGKAAELLGQKDAQIASLNAEAAQQAEKAKAEQELAVRQAQDALAESLAQAKRERDELAAKLESLAKQSAVEQDLAVQKAERSAEERRRALERERDELAAQVQLERTKAEQAAAQHQAEAERAEAAHELELASKMQLKEDELALARREIEDMRRMRAELTVKAVGESLEQFCENEFNKLRATGFQRACFGKDNDAADGSKGDYIYRELDDDGAEVVSIMFEMKNEADSSSHKKRNADHFKKLDHDRTAKGCEYAVLVSLLERDSDYYNTGIVDVSYESGFDKMYVIRPQFFIPMITLIRNAALRSLEYRRELDVVRRQNVDVTNFEEQLGKFKDGFGRNFNLAHRKFEGAIKDIDATIKKLEKIKEELTSSDNNLRLANDKLEGLTVKRLTRKNPTMKAAFAEAAAKREALAAAGDDDELDGDDLMEAELLEEE